MLRLTDSFLLREKWCRERNEAFFDGERALTAISRGSAREPVSMSVTSGASLKRIVPGRRSQSVKTPRPFSSVSRISIRVPRVSGKRRGTGERESGCLSGVEGGVMSCLMSSGGEREIVISRFSEGRRVGVVGVSVGAIVLMVDSDWSGIIGLLKKDC